MMIFGRDKSVDFLSRWIGDKSSIILVTAASSFTKCGARDFISPFLADKNVQHITTTGNNVQREDVEGLIQDYIAGRQIDAFIAVGGGTAIDMAKLLRAGLPTADIDFPCVSSPFLAIPTTAGTGAEATRFAVYYEHGKKCSADDVKYLPNDQILIPEFCETASDYQKAASGFDAYAQAVESLWAKRATNESRMYAQKALDLMKAGEQLLGAHWAGRAIDISRTTAAHAFSYYMTATFGVPHGEAVYMMFPYVCRANGHPEYIKEVSELRTLSSFVASRGVEWPELIDALFQNVNPARLSNNPCEIRKEHFYV